MIEKEYEKLKELEIELKAMKELNADEDIINQQLNKIKKQESRIRKNIKEGDINE